MNRPERLAQAVAARHGPDPLRSYPKLAPASFAGDTTDRASVQLCRTRVRLFAIPHLLGRSRRTMSPEFTGDSFDESARSSC